MSGSMADEPSSIRPPVTRAASLAAVLVGSVTLEPRPSSWGGDGNDRARAPLRTSSGGAAHLAPHRTRGPHPDARAAQGLFPSGVILSTSETDTGGEEP